MDAAEPLLNPRLRAAMLRFAQLHLQPRDEAEDAVQDALLALLESPQRLASAEDARRYVFGILKNKITDRLRFRYRSQKLTVDPVNEDGLDETLFDPSGHWNAANAPACWNTPETQLKSDQFFALVDACVNRLHQKVAQVFSMKELLDCEPQEICETLGLSKTDYWQCMSRARKQLQVCLNVHGFGKEGS